MLRQFLSLVETSVEWRKMSLFIAGTTPLDYPFYLVYMQISDGSNNVVDTNTWYMHPQTRTTQQQTNSLNATLSALKAWAGTHDWTVDYGAGAHCNLVQIELYQEVTDDVSANY